MKTTSKNVSLIISDTSPIVSLYCIDRLDILYKMFDKVIVPEGIYKHFNEIKDNLRITLNDNGTELSDINIEVRQAQEPEKITKILKDFPKLNKDEVEAIVIMEESEKNMQGKQQIFLDDRIAKNFSIQKNLKVIGTVNLITQAIALDMITKREELESYIKILKENNRFQSENFYTKVRKTLEEHILKQVQQDSQEINKNNNQIEKQKQRVRNIQKLSRFNFLLIVISTIFI